VGKLVADQNYDGAVKLLRTILVDKEKQYKLPELRRAGHMLSFNPGEQAHAGVGSGGYRCGLTKLPRVTLYATAVPAKVFPIMRNMDWAGAEGNTFGLVDDVDVNRVLIFKETQKEIRREET
jgi:hypothetical protein